MDKAKLQEILGKHIKWLRGEDNGERANLRDANLYDADLRDANLYGANLYGADLRGANLYGANLHDANLYDADLRDANLRGANLYGADLRGANLRGANLYGADLRGANLYGANLHDAKIEENIKKKFFPLNCPETGAFTGYKKANGLIVKLLIPDDARRSSAYGRKCRADMAKVLEILNPDGSKANKNEVQSDRNNTFIYRIGETVAVPNFDTDRWNECSTGIHFFITFDEARDYN